VERVVATGLSRVQLALVPLLESFDEWAGVTDALQSAGIEIVSGMLETIDEDYSTLESIAKTGGIRRDDLWPMNHDRIEACVAIAAECDVSLVSLHVGHLPPTAQESERATVLERVRTLAELFQPLDIDVALETGQESAETLIGVLEELDEPNLGVNFDPANVLLYGTDEPLRALERLQPWVRQFHLKDATPASTPGEWGTEMRLGEGDVDWDAFIRLARGLNRDIDFIIECEAGEQRVDDVRHAAETFAARWHAIDQ